MPSTQKSHLHHDNIPFWCHSLYFEGIASSMPTRSQKLRSYSSFLHFQFNWNNGAGIEWVVWQVMDKYWTNIWHLSNTCPIFVKDLSKSNICRSFVVSVQILSTFVSMCLHSTWKRIFICPIFLKFDKSWTNSCPIHDPYLSTTQPLQGSNGVSNICQSIVHV